MICSFFNEALSVSPLIKFNFILCVLNCFLIKSELPNLKNLILFLQFFVNFNFLLFSSSFAFLSIKSLLLLVYCLSVEFNKFINSVIEALLFFDSSSSLLIFNIEEHWVFVILLSLFTVFK